MTGDILFLAHRLPYPPDRGDKIRSHHVLKALAKLAPVHVGCLAENETDLANENALSHDARSWCMPRRSTFLPKSGLEALARGEPVSLAAFRSRELQDWVRRTLHRESIGAIYVYSGQMGQYVPRDWQGRLIADLVDVDSAKFEAYGKTGRGPRSWIDRREARLLRAVEADLASRAEATLLVSEAEAGLLRRRAPGARNVRALRNGIDCALYDPDAVAAEKALTAGGPHYVFTGQMDYAPNVEAVTRMARQVMPALRRHLPAVQFHIVGRAPSAPVRALHGVEGTRVVGEVADTRPWLAGADAVVAPLAIARGVQNKVLEAMAMARPVVLSPDAATGIDARNGAHYLIADDDAAFVEHLRHLHAELRRAAALGRDARRFVLEKMSWDAMLADLPALLGMDKQGERNAA
ncbi:TIGR03087 family PEP-CTERM/XrtA system glycosyltransferase [Aurantiacibacter hainanensis]|uniref:TIGR03087 family PEP-CTERM/XrtA system glycosyltransferase n=1 Tax=Aurantiacibacter hainanensis TaxID=3076114 RepID=UPI0030C7391B